MKAPRLCEAQGRAADAEALQAWIKREREKPPPGDG
jgi:hypothetical protein